MCGIASFFLFIGGCVTRDSTIFVAAGLFAIAGSISAKEAKITNEIVYREGTQKDSQEIKD